jgi:hypothetical protein
MVCNYYKNVCPILKKMALLNNIVVFYTLLIGAEGTRLLREYGQGRPHRRFSAEEAPRHARGKRVPVAEINSIV